MFVFLFGGVYGFELIICSGDIEGIVCVVFEVGFFLVWLNVGDVDFFLWLVVIFIEVVMEVMLV